MKRSISLFGILVIVLATGVMLGYQLRGRGESVGERLRRECGSIVDAAGPQLINMNIMERLETLPGVAEKLREQRFRYPSEKIDFLLGLSGTAEWTEARRQALILKREEMVRSCVLKRGS